MEPKRALCYLVLSKDKQLQVREREKEAEGQGAVHTNDDEQRVHRSAT